MPTVSKRQQRLMLAVAHNKKFARKVGIPTSVGEDFVEADKRAGRLKSTIANRIRKRRQSN